MTKNPESHANSIATNKMDITDAISMFHEAVQVHHAQIVGGYPDEIDEFGGVIAITDTIDGKVGLEMIDADQFLSWMKDAKRSYDQGEFDDLWEAIYETKDCHVKPCA